MSGTVNKAILLGRLTRDPELRTTQSGKGVCNLAVATDKWGQDKGADFHDVVVWDQGTRKLASLCAEHLAKGSQVYVEGRMETRSWEDKSGQKKYRTEVIASDVQFVGRKPQDADSGHTFGHTTDDEVPW